MSQVFLEWDFGAQVHAPCADISFARLPQGKLRLLLYFSLVRDGIPNDLEITFNRAVAMTWHEEALHSVSVGWPKSLPRLVDGKWKGWTHPFLQVHESDWLRRLDYMPLVKGLGHFALVAMNDIVEVLADPTPSFRWVPKDGA